MPVEVTPEGRKYFKRKAHAVEKIKWTPTGHLWGPHGTATATIKPSGAAKKGGEFEVEFEKEGDKLFAYAYGPGIEPFLNWICASGGGAVDAVVWARDRKSATSYYPCRATERRLLALPAEERKKIVDEMMLKQGWSLGPGGTYTKKVATGVVVLPKVKIGGKPYFRDDRLEEFRSVDRPGDRPIKFEELGAYATGEEVRAIFGGQTVTAAIPKGELVCDACNKLLTYKWTTYPDGHKVKVGGMDYFSEKAYWTEWGLVCEADYIKYHLPHAKEHPGYLIQSFRPDEPVPEQLKKPLVITSFGPPSPPLPKMKWQDAWDKVMEKGKRQEPGITNKLTEEDLATIVATIHFLEPNENFLKQVYFDLARARFRVFDWVAMLLFGRHKGYGENATELKNQQFITRVMTDAYLKGEGVKGFIDVLRSTDYQITEPLEIVW